ncbi:hypothetical protein [Ideonella livida]|uniref:Uncharacterized protein n=1 Tax=Ideonella livida TaxID=2707176 RepID=A0A7C9PI56_9BURK|nr:hypothetical protein [Ideonella livida]NDY92516.1 hypothetical protein [Ideonella livida]
MSPTPPAPHPFSWTDVPGLPDWVPGARRPARAGAVRGAAPRPVTPGALDPGEIERRRALLGLLAADLARGNQQLALRHYLMLVALGSPVPAAFSQRCEALLAACPASRLQRIRADVARWRAHSRPGATGGATPPGFDLSLLER